MSVFMCITCIVTVCVHIKPPGEGRGIGVVWAHIPEAQQHIIDDFVPLKIVESSELVLLSAALARSFKALFQPCHKDLVACLCVQLGYVRAAHEVLLGGICADVQDDPLDLFKPARSDPERSRFEMLFLEEDAESDGL